MLFKVCKICKVEKLLEEFWKCTGHKDGRHNYCIVCDKIRKKAYYEKNKEEVIRKVKAYYDTDPEKCKARIKKHRTLNIEAINKKDREYHYANKEHRNELCRQYHKDNKEELGRKKRIYVNKRKETDEEYKVRLLFRDRIHKALKNNSRNCSSLDYLGCDVTTTKAHIEAQFEPWMTWENHGLFTWHIDHIIPICNFNMLDEEERKLAFHYTNLQPLSAKDNLTKGKYIIRKKSENDIP